MACFPIKVSAVRPSSALQNSPLWRRKKRLHKQAAAAYDAEEKDLITKTRKIIAASNRALRDAEAVLKRR